MKKDMAGLINLQDFLDESFRLNPGHREEWERTALARAVALKIIRYRAEHGLSQTALATMLGMKQPAIARLEIGETNPSLETLRRLSEGLEIEFLIDIAPTRHRKLVTPEGLNRAATREQTNGDRASVLIATT